jgi:hypothetical protein
MSEASIKEKAKQQRELNAVVKNILADFVGRDITPLLAAEAESRVREALVGLIIRGTYVLPPGLSLDRVELNKDMMINVYFKRAPVGEIV